MKNKTKIRVVKYTPVQFSNEFGHLSEKYGEDYMDVVVEDLLKQGIKVEWDYES
jgi:hypothetical protein